MVKTIRHINRLLEQSLEHQEQSRHLCWRCGGVLCIRWWVYKKMLKTPADPKIQQHKLIGVFDPRLLLACVNEILQSLM